MLLHDTLDQALCINELDEVEHFFDLLGGVLKQLSYLSLPSPATVTHDESQVLVEEETTTVLERDLDVSMLLHLLQLLLVERVWVVTLFQVLVFVTVVLVRLHKKLAVL